MKTKKYYIILLTWVGILFISAICVSGLDALARELIKGFGLFGLTVFLLTAIQMHYTQALLQYLKQTDPEAYTFSKKTISPQKINFSPSFPYREDTRDVIAAYNFFTIWPRFGVALIALILIII